LWMQYWIFWLRKMHGISWIAEELLASQEGALLQVVSCMKCCNCVLLVQISCFRAAQSVKILIALAVYCTYGLQFYVCLEIGWNAVKNTFTKRPVVSEYALRTFLIALTGKWPLFILFYWLT
jgi:hypothetical protein